MPIISTDLSIKGAIYYRAECGRCDKVVERRIGSSYEVQEISVPAGFKWAAQVLLCRECEDALRLMVNDACETARKRVVKDFFSQPKLTPRKITVDDQQT